MCRYCGKTPIKDDTVVLCLDHIIPRSKKGPDTADNLVTACMECNTHKRDKILEEGLLNLVKDQVGVRNKELGIYGKKVIKGSHVRD
jgi:5-methylcytosine-specific restriction endonuclease McrA